jgi:hypothetical protein
VKAQLLAVTPKRLAPTVNEGKDWAHLINRSFVWL